jgi:hypothetical protein
MRKIEKYLPWSIRIFVSLLFLVSAVAKMFPIWAFEKQFVDLGVASWCQAPYIARLMIALELAVSIVILQRNFLKSIVIPGTILFLSVFCVHLSIQMYKYGLMTGNCGCFGQLIPMTPFEAFVKNIITIGLLVYLYRKVSDKEKGHNNITYLIFPYVASALFMFMVFPFCPCAKETNSEGAIENTDSVSIEKKDTLALNSETPKKEIVNQQDGKAIAVESGPTKVKSRFAEFKVFGGKRTNLDEGKKLVCLFAAGCDHCRETAKELCSWSRNANDPEIYVLFMDEETNLIPEFFNESRCRFPYQIIDIPKFWTLMGADGNTPGVFYLWNGNIIKSFEGEGANKFNLPALKKACGSGDGD